MAKQQEIFSPSDLKRGEQLLRQKKLRIVQFAEGTYQFEVKDPLKRGPIFLFCISTIKGNHRLFLHLPHRRKEDLLPPSRCCVFTSF